MKLKLSEAKTLKITKLCLGIGLLLVICLIPKPAQAQFTVTFETFGGSSVAPLNNVTSIETEPVTTKTGYYRFDGWYATPNFSGSKIVFPFTPTDDMTLFAKWNIPMFFAACAATNELAVLDNDLNLTGNFLVGYPSLEEYSLPAALGLHNNHILVIDVVMTGLFAYDFNTFPPVAVGHGDNLGSQPNEIIVDGNYGYVIVSGSDLIRVIDLTATSTSFGNQRTVTTIPARIGTGTERTNPNYGVVYNDKLYVSLTGLTGMTGGDKILEIAVRDIDPNIPSTTPQILATRELSFPASELQMDPEFSANYSSPAGISAANGKLYVTLGNLGVVSGIPAPVGAGYLAEINIATWTKQIHIMPQGCRNPKHVLATDTRIYVSCAGNYGQGDVQTEALVVLDAITKDIVNVTTFLPSLPNGTESGPVNPTNATPGRLAIAGNRVVIADEMTNRLFVTDLNGTILQGMANGIVICDFKYYTPTWASQAIMDVVSRFIPVDSIIGLQTETTEDVSLTLTSAVTPYYASNTNIIWEVTNAGTTDASIIGNVFNAETAGTAEITATIKNGLAIGQNYTQIFNITVVESDEPPVSIAEDILIDRIIIFPNPVKDELIIESGDLKINRMTIFDMSGRKIMTKNSNKENSINVSALQQGVYVLKIETDKGIVSKTFVKN
jgi:uncharacterized repeat protein (TIGR02543 family)